MMTYRYQVNFSKRFVTGILRGRLYHDYLRFVDWKAADAFRALCESGHEFEPGERKAARSASRDADRPRCYFGECGHGNCNGCGAIVGER